MPQAWSALCYFPNNVLFQKCFGLEAAKCFALLRSLSISKRIVMERLSHFPTRTDSSAPLSSFWACRMPRKVEGAFFLVEIKT
jgi:hypothetical protein